MEADDIVSPFVMKTYQMVNDQTTDQLIRWGGANNSFVVIDPLYFSRRILPFYFKHSNFSSFVRQLNTYGFRKVDPDGWEFANKHFLRGQIHLLKNIVRRKQTRGSAAQFGCGEEIGMEIARLREEQAALDEEIRGMKERLEEAERRPHQMMAFLRRVASDPDLVPRLMAQRERSKQITAAEKRRRLMISSEESDEREIPTVGLILSSSCSSETVIDSGNFGGSSPSSENSLGERRQWETSNLGDGDGFSGNVGVNVTDTPSFSFLTSLSSGNMIGARFDQPREGRKGNLGEIKAVGLESSPPPSLPFPFSLLGGGF